MQRDCGCTARPQCKRMDRPSRKRKQIEDEGSKSPRAKMLKLATRQAICGQLLRVRLPIGRSSAELNTWNALVRWPKDLYKMVAGVERPAI